MRKVVELIPAAIEHGLIPLCVRRDVCVAPLLHALEAAGLTYRHDVRAKVVIIEPLEAEENAPT